MGEIQDYEEGWNAALNAVQKSLMDAQVEPHKEPADYAFGCVQDLLKKTDAARQNLKRLSHIRTFTGKTFYPFKPNPNDIDIIDVAHALSNQCRFIGHSTSFYSVAQHCVLVSQHVPHEFALWGLLHDASEAYMSDVATPIKHMPEMYGYRNAEKLVMQAVCKAFGLVPVEPEAVHIADKRMLATEQMCLGSAPHNSSGFDPYDFLIEPMLPAQAKAAYLTRFIELTWCNR